MAVPVVALYGSLNALFNLYLANNVSNARKKHKVSIGHKENKDVELAARIHGNNAEFVPLALLMLLIAELQGLSAMWLHVLGGALFVGRVLHAYGMPKPAPNFGRFTGVATTWICIAATSVWILVMRFKGS
ncbi:MAG: MAPEG family protein [Polyangiaceae bacterium]|nr:MAPEG family protein [Polyangiaceae bacterium]